MDQKQKNMIYRVREVLGYIRWSLASKSIKEIHFSYLVLPDGSEVAGLYAGLPGEVSGRHFDLDDSKVQVSDSQVSLWVSWHQVSQPRQQICLWTKG